MFLCDSGLYFRVWSIRTKPKKTFFKLFKNLSFPATVELF